MASPIETRLLEAMRAGVEVHNLLSVTDQTGRPAEANFGTKGNLNVEWTYKDDTYPNSYGLMRPEVVWHLFSEVSIETYRVDYLFWDERFSLGVVVECDGHDYHERTKQQAAYDKARDRELVSRGLQVMRFTGSEIHHSAERCAHEVLALLQRLVRSAVANEQHVLAVFEAGMAAGRRGRPAQSAGLLAGVV